MIVPAPAEFYTHNFDHVLAWVRQHHSHLIDPALGRWMRAVDGLSEGARHLLVRLLMRRGPHFRLDLLNYPGVTRVHYAALELALSGLAAIEASTSIRIASLRVPELEARLEALGARQRGARRALLRERLESCLAAGATVELPSVLRLGRGDDVACLRLLYFGSLRQDLSEFVLADIGALRWAQVGLAPKLPFAHASEVRRAVAVHRLADAVSSIEHRVRPRAKVELSFCRALSDALADASPCRLTEARRARALERVAHWQARQGAHGGALRTLRRAASPGARERACRLLAQRGRRKAAEALRAHMACAPQTDEEARFAARFDVAAVRCRPQRRGASIPVRRLYLRPLREARVEQRVVEHYRAGGNRALHLENRLPGMLFMLTCWDIVFSPLPGAFVQPFQAGPTDLYTEDFWARRREAIEARLEAVRCGVYGVEDCLGVLERELGTVNPFWGWQGAGVVPHILRSIPRGVRAGICELVAREPRRARVGFPDLTIANGAPSCLAFIEVKGPGDQLRESQRRWLEDLQALGVRAEVLEVRFP